MQMKRLLPVLVGFVAVFMFLRHVQVEALIHACDRLAKRPVDRDSPGEGVKSQNIVPACIKESVDAERQK